MAYFRSNHFDTLFGDGSLGNKVIDTNTVWNAPTDETNVIEKKYKNLTIESGFTVSAGNRNAGIIIRCTGDCIIHGTLKNQYACRSLLENSEALARVTALYPAWMVANGAGGAGGASGAGSDTYRHQAQLGRFYGGGHGAGGDGGGAMSLYAYHVSMFGGAGGATTETDMSSTGLFENGTGPAVASWTYLSGNYYGEAEGGAGANGGGGGGGAQSSSARNGQSSATGGGGGGGTGGIWNGGSGSNGAGAGGGGGCGGYGAGAIILFVRGSIIIDGTLNCNGSNGGNGGNGAFKDKGYYGFGGGAQAGGAGGGGRIYLLAKDEITLTGGTFSVLGGTGGTAGRSDTGYSAGLNGLNGGDGTKHYTTYADYMNGVAPTVIAS